MYSTSPRRRVVSLDPQRTEADTVTRRSMASMTLDERHEKLNSLFGFTPWKPHVAKRALGDHSLTVQQLHAPASKIVPGMSSERFVNFGNLLYGVFIGTWAALVYAIVGTILFMTYFPRRYGRLCFNLAGYVFWPFGRCIEQIRTAKQREALPPSLMGPNEKTSLFPALRPISTSDFISNIVWYLLAAPPLLLLHAVIMMITWFGVISIPMAKVHSALIRHVVMRPSRIAVRYTTPQPGAEVLICTYTAVNAFYYKYTVFGLNIMIMNLSPFIFAVLALWAPPFKQIREDSPALIFFLCLGAIVPLAYYIGTAVSMISAQTSFAVGAVLNATFGSIIELIIYYGALKEGLGEVVQQAVTGSLLGTMLLLPGLAMLGGGMKHKEMHFNPTAAGVSGVLLLVAVGGAFAPTLLYQFYGSYKLDCHDCLPIGDGNFTLACGKCHSAQRTLSSGLADDPVYQGPVRHLMFFCAIVLPIMYFIGLLFTLKTHSFIYESDSDEEDSLNPAEKKVEKGEWSRRRSVLVLLFATIAFAGVSELLARTLSSAVQELGMTAQFCGLTFIALVPNTAEFVNAIQFALQNNFALAIEIGSSAAVQISLIQIPVLILMDFLVKAEEPFSMVFPLLDVFAVFMAVLVIIFIGIDGKANYFEGAGLIFVYAILICLFWNIPTDVMNSANITLGT